MRFQIGNEFASYEEFVRKLREYENTVFANYPIGSSVKLKESPRFSIDTVNKFRYQRATLYCKCAGQHVSGENSERQGSTFKQGCQSKITIAIKKKDW